MTENTPQPAGPMSEAEERNQAKLTHIINGFFPLIGGLIFWLIGKDRSAFVDRNGKEAVNFGINIAIGLIVSSFLMWVLIGFFTYFAIWIYSIIMGFKAGGEAEKGAEFRYPFAPLRLIS